MEKKQIIWDHHEPPKNYYWAKPDGQIYEFDKEAHEWVVSNINSSDLPL